VHSACPCSPKMSRKCEAGPSQPRHFQPWWKNSPGTRDVYQRSSTPLQKLWLSRAYFVCQALYIAQWNRWATAQLTFLVTCRTRRPTWWRMAPGSQCLSQRSWRVNTTGNLSVPTSPSSFPHRMRGPEEESGDKEDGGADDSQNGGEPWTLQSVSPLSSSQL